MKKNAVKGANSNRRKSSRKATKQGGTARGLRATGTQKRTTKKIAKKAVKKKATKAAKKKATGKKAAKAVKKKATGKKAAGKKAAGKKAAGKKAAGKKAVKTAKATKKKAAERKPGKKTTEKTAKKKAVRRRAATRKTAKRRAPPRTPPSGHEPYRPLPDEEYMNDGQLEHFRQLLLAKRRELTEGEDATIHGMQESATHFADEADRASKEEELALKLRTQEREHRLLKKIDAALLRVEDGTYGYCEKTGEEIGLSRLEARPMATLCLEAQQRREQEKRQFRDSDERSR